MYANKKVITSYGNAKIVNTVLSSDGKNLFVIADGAAFGPLIEDFISMFDNESSKCVVLWAPESFEYLIIKSGVLGDNRFKDILENTSNYVDSKYYVSWERYFTDLLVDSTKDSYKAYSKDTLNAFYLKELVVDKIATTIPSALQPVVSNMNLF